jgi:AcrR family transcriptional regulator
MKAMVLAASDPGPTGRGPAAPGGDPQRAADSTRAAERTRIREALLDLCLERGYRQLDLALLLERAEVDEAAFEHHFDDFEDCFCVVYQEIRDELFERFARAIAGQESWRDRIRATAYVFLRFLREDSRVTHLAVIDVRSAGERALRLFTEAFEDLNNLLDQGRGERRHPDSLSRATAEAIGGGIFGQMYAAVENGTLDLGEEAVPKLMYAAVLPYLGVQAASEELEILPPPPNSVPPPSPRRDLSD